MKENTSRIYTVCVLMSFGSAIILPLHKARRSRLLCFTEFCQAKQMQVVASIIQHKMASHSFSKPWQEQIQFSVPLFTFIPSPLLCTDILGILCRGFLIGKVFFFPKWDSKYEWNISNLLPRADYVSFKFNSLLNQSAVKCAPLRCLLWMLN